MTQSIQAKPPRNGLKERRFGLWIGLVKVQILNYIKMLWLDLKQAVHARCSSNLSQLAEEYNEEWAKIPKGKFERLVSGYRRRLVEVMAAKGCAS